MSAHDEDGGRHHRTLAKVSLSLVSTTMAEASTYSLDAVKTRHLQLHRSPDGAGAMGWILINSNVEVACYGKPCYWLINLASKCGM
uniref:Uncharacterized protein n=1 Tax=Zea mays TaxID=4577 RepID=A0A804RFS2_MAIZE